MDNYESICTCVGRLYLESQHRFFVLQKQFEQLKRENEEQLKYIEELEKKLGVRS